MCPIQLTKYIVLMYMLGLNTVTLVKHDFFKAH